MCVQDVDVQCVLQFTIGNAAGCALHRLASRVIHRSGVSFQVFLFLTGGLSAPHSSSCLHGFTKEKKSGKLSTWPGAVLFLGEECPRSRRPPSAQKGARLRYRDQAGRRDWRPPATHMPADLSLRDRPAGGPSPTESLLPMQLFSNDPSEGSPTETLLRLLLPLDDQVRTSSRLAGSENLASCRSNVLTKPSNR